MKEEQFFSEVLAVSLAEPDIEGIGLLFDIDQYQSFPSLDASSKVKSVRVDSMNYKQW